MYLGISVFVGPITISLRYKCVFAKFDLLLAPLPLCGKMLLI